MVDSLEDRRLIKIERSLKEHKEALDEHIQREETTLGKVHEAVTDNMDNIGKISQRLTDGDTRMDIQGKAIVELQTTVRDGLVIPLAPVIQVSKDFGGFMRISLLLLKFVVVPMIASSVLAGGLHMSGVIDLIGLIL